jgi:hypothetical protein
MIKTLIKNKTLTAEIVMVPHEVFELSTTIVTLSYRNYHITTRAKVDWMDLIDSVNRWAKRNKFTRINWKDA